MIENLGISSNIGIEKLILEIATLESESNLFTLKKEI
jgi:hypothetical protein